MIYRRQPSKNKRPLPSNADQEAELKKSGDIKPVLNIPLPNQAEDTEAALTDDRGHSSSFINIFNHKIFLDEIILFGLIFVLFTEGIEDEFLLIILLYILLVGRL